MRDTGFRKWRGLLLPFLLLSCWFALGADPLLDRLTKAQELITQGDLETAERLLLRTAAEFAPDPRVSNFLGVIYAQQGETAKAETNLRQAVKMAPGFVGALLNLGRLYQESLTLDPSYLQRAIDTYSQVLKVEPHSIEGIYQLAFLLHLKQDYRESQDYLDRLPEENQQHPQALALRCGNSAGLGQVDAMEKSCGALTVSSMLVEEDVLQILPALVQASQTERGIQLLEQLRTKNNLSIEGQEQLGFLYLEVGNYTLARLTLERMAASHPKLEELLVRLAWVSYRAGEYEQTLGYLAHARDLTPQDARLHAFFGLACIDLGLGVEAMKSLEQALSLEPENPFYNYILATAILHWREPTEAIPYFEKFLQLNPRDPKGPAGLGRAYFLNKEYDRARIQFEKVVQEPEVAPEAHFYLGAIDRLERKLTEAQEHLSAALKLRPDYPDAMAELGWIHTRNSEFEEAEKILNKTLMLDPDHYQANFNLMTLYSRTRDERYETQKERFEQVKEQKWQAYSDSLRSIEAVPHQVYPNLQLEFRQDR